MIIRKWINTKNIAYCCILTASWLSIWYIIITKTLCGSLSYIDSEKIKNLQLFTTGIIVPLLTLGTSLLIVQTFRTTQIQNITNNFFKLIDQNRQILKEINAEPISSDKSYIQSSGKDFLDDLALMIATQYYHIKDGKALDTSIIPEDLYNDCQSLNDQETLVKIYTYNYHIYQSDLAHYIRNLYYIVKYIDKEKLTKEYKFDLLGILRSQLSNYEQLILAYNGLYSQGTKFFALINKYELVKSINPENELSSNYKKRIVDPNILKKNYPHLKARWEEN